MLRQFGSNMIKMFIEVQISIKKYAQLLISLTRVNFRAAALNFLNDILAIKFSGN